MKSSNLEEQKTGHCDQFINSGMLHLSNSSQFIFLIWRRTMPGAVYPSPSFDNQVNFFDNRIAF